MAVRIILQNNLLGLAAHNGRDGLGPIVIRQKKTDVINNRPKTDRLMSAYASK
jgi:hypothetical protein